MSNNNEEDNSVEMPHRELELMLHHAVVCAMSFIQPGEYIPSFIYEGSDNDVRVKVNLYTNTHRFWARAVWLGRKN